jgi:putative DNA primase/helicase
LRLADVARIWQQAGVSVVPILANRTKRPAVQWGEYQAHAPTLNQIDEWWGNGHGYGLALVCGPVSGNMEMTEIEGRACGAESMASINEAMLRLGAAHIWDLLSGHRGYSEMSPSGGIHLLYRVSDHEVPGNKKIASVGTGPDTLVLAETRGAGGYVIVAPTSGLCHPSGEAWVMINGNYGVLPTITWEERCLIHEALRQALHEGEGDEAPLPNQNVAIPAPTPVLSGNMSPGDHFEATVDWADILEPHGWTFHSRNNHERWWTRPGKDRRDGHSATTGHRHDRERLYVFSSSTIFDTGNPYTKFGAFAVLNHGGDHREAAVALRRQGYGISETTPVQLLSPMDGELDEPQYLNNDTGNAQYLFDRVRDRFRFVAEEQQTIAWDGRVWRPDLKKELEYAFTTMAQERYYQAQGDKENQKRWLSAGNKDKINAACSVVRAIPGFTVSTEELNPVRRLVNLRNGVLDLENGEMRPHDPSFMMTQMMGASFDPEAQCPRFDDFMARVLPDEDMRRYVQRALGYTLLGEADQRCLFLIHGPSGTGKSTLMEIMEMVFGDYGMAAPTGTFRAGGRDGGPLNDLHTIRGCRFVSTSETNERTAYDEDLLKRLTGRDAIQSRELYQKFQSWRPQCTIWLATNHAPRFNSDDDAIWRRAKMVPFTTVLTGSGEIFGYAEKVLAQELDGIFNWLLAGLHDFQAFGLEEPGEVQDAATDLRMQSDPVARFVDDKLSDGVLVRGGGQIRTVELYTMYLEWNRATGERALGSRRFANRLQSNFPDVNLIKENGAVSWDGIQRGTGVSILGSIVPTGSWFPRDD